MNDRQSRSERGRSAGGAGRERRSDEPRQRRTRRRGQTAALVAIMLLAIGCIVFLAAVEIVRRSDYVKGRVTGEIQAITGLSVEAGAIGVAWDGTTTVRDLRLLLPPDGEAVLESPLMTIKHSSLMSVILRRSVDIQTIDVAQPTVLTSEGPDGWTLTRAIDRIVAHNAGGAEDSSNDLPDIPPIRGTEGVLRLTTDGGETVETPLDVVCEPGPARYTVDLRLGGSRAKLTLALGADWRHSVDADLAPSREMWRVASARLGMEQLAGGEGAGDEGEAGAPPHLQMRWRGQRKSGGLAGTLRIERGSFAGVEFDGALRIGPGGMWSGGADQLHEDHDVVVTVEKLALQRAGQTIEFAGGRARVAGAQVEFDRVQFATAWVGGVAEGRVNLDRREGDLTMRFFGVAPVGGFEHAGSLEAEVRSFGGFPEIRAALSVRGQGARGEVDLAAALEATGRAWDDLQGALHLERLTIRRDEEVWDAGGVRLEAALYDQQLALTHFRAEGAARSLGSGRLDLEDLAWELELEASEWAIGPWAESATVGVDARGTAGAVERWRAALETDRLSVIGEGAYVPQDPEPVAASLVIATGGGDEEAGARDEHESDEHEHAETPRAEDSAAPAPKQRGLARLLELDREASLELDLQGTLDPLRLRGASVLRTQPLAPGDSPELFALRGAAEFDASGLRVTSEQFDAFDGACIVRIGATRGEGVAVIAECSDLSLEALSTFLEITPEVSGRAEAQLRARWPRRDQSRLVVDGRWEVADLAVGPLEAEAAAGRLDIQGGQVRLSQVLLSRGDGRLRGEIETDMETWRRVSVDLSSEGYLAQWRDVDALITGEVAGDVDVSQWTGDMTGRISAQVARAGTPLGEVEMEGELDGRLLRVQRLSGDLAGGSIEGAALVPLDRWTASEARVEVEEVSSAELVPELQEVGGLISGAIEMRPSEDPHAIAPLHLKALLQLEDGSVRGVEVGRIELEAFLGDPRSVLEQARIEIAGGELTLWANTNDHDGDRYIQVAGEARNLDLDLLVHAVAPDAKSYPGRLTMEFGGAGYLGAPERLFAHAQLALREADLVNIPVIAELFQLASIVGAEREPSGSGEATVRLEGRSLRLPEARYFDEGTEMRLALHLVNVWEGGDSPLRGGAVVWLRPLANLNLPLAEELDRLLAGLQFGGTSVRITGTVADPETHEAPLKELQDLVGRAIGVE